MHIPVGPAMPLQGVRPKVIIVQNIMSTRLFTAALLVIKKIGSNQNFPQIVHPYNGIPSKRMKLGTGGSGKYMKV